MAMKHNWRFDMRKIAIVLSLFVCLLSGCGRYSESDMKAIKERAYEAGYKEAKIDYGGTEGTYSEGYDDGWYAAMREAEGKKKDSNSSEADALLGKVERNLEDVIASLYYDDPVYSAAEIEGILTSTYTAVVRYNESH